MLESPQIKKLIQLAIEEDLGSGDVTSELLVPAEHESRGIIEAREKLVVCGLPMIEKIFSELGWEVNIKCFRREGEVVPAGAVLSELSGKTRQLLAAERIVLNFLQRLCGVATYTRNFLPEGLKLTVLDTRKTTPGWRLLEKYAVAMGGAQNHRINLGDMILVKDNHIDATGVTGKGLAARLAELKAEKPAYLPWEVEVRDSGELQEALLAQPDIIMLDNMDDRQIEAALKLIREKAPQCKVEVSGGMSRERLKMLDALGVDCVSVGALTRKATFVDIAMQIHPRT